MSEGEFYNIEKILDKRINNGKVEYKIKWEGYSMSECTWEPMKNLETVKELVDEYNLAHPTNDQKTTKSEHKKKAKTFINKKQKRKEEKVEKNGKEENEEKLEEDKKIEEVVPLETPEEPKNNQVPEDSKPVDVEKTEETNFIIDDSLRKVITVKQLNQKLMAVVEKMNENGDVTKDYIPTEELRKSNPWILLNFYESKIKFT